MSQLFKVEVVPYNDLWLEIFRRESDQIRDALGDNCLDVLHIGSTSVPGLAAKPIIDMIPVVKNINDVKRAKFEAQGYTWCGEHGMLFRRFVYRYREDLKIHAHIWEQGNPEIEKHILFARYLKEHPVDLKAYEDLKVELARMNSSDNVAYSLKKDALIKDILKRAGFNGCVIVEALTDREWDAVSRLLRITVAGLKHARGEFDQIKEDKYFVLSKGVIEVGAASLVQDKGQYKIKALVIDPIYLNQGLDTYFRTQLERWISLCS